MGDKKVCFTIEEWLSDMIKLGDYMESQKRTKTGCKKHNQILETKRRLLSMQHTFIYHITRRGFPVIRSIFEHCSTMMINVCCVPVCTKFTNCKFCRNRKQCQECLKCLGCMAFVGIYPEKEYRRNERKWKQDQESNHKSRKYLLYSRHLY